MAVILRIALRNLKEHRSKTLIIGTIIAVGIMVMTIGTSLIDTATLGIEKNFIENYTGNILIGGISEDDLSIFGVQSPGGIEPTPTLPEFSRIADYLDSRREIEIYTPQVTGFASVTLPDQEDPDARGMTFLFGIEPLSHQAMFDKVEVVEGRFLEPGEAGILMAQSNRKRIADRLKRDLDVGDSVILTGFSDAGIKIREVEVKGFYRLLSEGDGINMSSYIDLQTLRALKAMNVGGLQEIILDERSTALLDTMEIDDLFTTDAAGGELFSAAEIGSIDSSGSWDDEQSFFDPFAGSRTTGSESPEFPEDSPALSEPETQAASASGFSLQDPRQSGVAPAAGTQETDGQISALAGSFEFILIGLKNPRRTSRIVNELNQWFLEEGIAAQAMDWKGAAGPFSSTADVIRTVFNVAVLLVAFIALIIITNTLLISVMERKREIGTMRAIGAGKGFVTAMFTGEITVLALVFGTIGQLAGLGVLGIVSLINIEAGNSLVEILFAGPVLRPVVHASTLIVNQAVVLVIGLIADIYPVRTALRIEPVKAIGSI